MTGSVNHGSVRKTTNERRLIAAALVLSIVGELIGAATFAVGGYLQDTMVGFAGWLVLMPSILTLVFLFINAAAIPFPYNYFGPAKRTPFPAHWPRAPTYWTSVCISDFQKGITGVWFTAEGLGFSLFPFERVFIPVDEICQISLTGTDLVVHHACPEVRSPVSVVLGQLFFHRSAWTAEEREAAAATFFEACREHESRRSKPLSSSDADCGRGVSTRLSIARDALCCVFSFVERS